MRKIRKGDEVVVIAGRDKGKRGDVRASSTTPRSRDGVNLVKKHASPIR
jgi:large subunit ribosomal protein L24